ncbi:helix-turn-helix domain-containing protein [Chloroflexota bacterium]
MKTIEKQFGKRLRELRLARGLSQEKLAFNSRMHRTYLGSVERGERNPSLKNIAAIAEALGVSLSQLFSFEDRTSSAGRSFNK